jgi:hypothetical protein
MPIPQTLYVIYINNLTLVWIQTTWKTMHPLYKYWFVEGFQTLFSDFLVEKILIFHELFCKEIVFYVWIVGIQQNFAIFCNIL